ncbi:ParB/RepB/Spo0J family partition protein [Burkholderia gladioli]|uniref:ParB/RepB/Spo0J family partition protein n=1 Tax=Burkholderia gladioli TaxID=28095 RepID=UPI00164233D0|nr:hypothetical protein [Burkholderia gladioli]
MAKNSIDAYGAAGKSNVLFFDPAALTLITDPSHALFDRRALLPPDEALVMNIMQLGVLETIIVAKDVESGETFVVDGRRRTIAAREANRRLAELGKPLVRIPALPRRDGMAGLNRMMVAANEIRRADSVINRAEKMAGMRLRGHTDEEIAIDFGIEPSTVASQLKLLDCCAAVRDALDSGEITAAAALKLSRFEPDAQRIALRDMRKAAEGKEGRDRGLAQKEALRVSLGGGGAPATKMRSRKQIEQAAAAARGDVAATLRWVLGQEEVAPWETVVQESDPRQLSIVGAV